MTRETKTGLIVAGSFLCLVCVVVASKWRDGDDQEPEEQTIKVAAVKETKNGSPPEAKKNDPIPKIEPEPKKAAPVSEPQAPPLIPPPVGGVQLPGDGPVTLPMPPVLPPPGEFKPLNGVEPKIELPPSLPKDLAPGPGIGADAGFPPPKPLMIEEKKPLLPEAPKLVGGTLEMPPLVFPPMETKPLVKPEVPAPTLPFTEKEQPMLPALPPKDATPKDQAPGAIVFPKLPAPKEAAPMVPSLETPKPVEKDGLPTPPTLSFPKDPPSTPPAFDLTPKPTPKIPPNELPSVPTMPLVGVGGPKPLPAVRDVNTDPYVCVAGDRTFADLSRRFYGSEKYADALLAYNQEHAKWIKNGSALLTNPPTLMPGQQVEQPPVAILNRSYRTLIREASVSAVPTIPSTTPKAAPPVTLGTPPGLANVSNPPSTGKGGTYRVQNPNGETVFDVAERTLGNRSQWPEIWRVNQTNPAVRPPAPIPFGTELKLP